MGIGMNFVCGQCGYDTGLLMMNQGSNHSVKKMIENYIYTYSHELDSKMLPSRASEYQVIINTILEKEVTDLIYNFYGCVCYGCRKTYEMLDILQHKEKEVYAGNKDFISPIPFQKIFEYPKDRWNSLIGEQPCCVFCHEHIIKLSEETLKKGVLCPKCLRGHLEVGEELQLWD